MSAQISLNPYLFFTGRCAEAIEFYRQAVGATVQMEMRYKDAPAEVKAQPNFNPADENRLMHARVTIAGSVVMMSDGPGTGNYDGFALALRTATAEEAKKYFEALAQGGTTVMPLEKTFFSPAFGMLKDKFGITWMVLTEGPH